MAELCCVLNSGWKCQLCDWKWCDDCLEARVFPHPGSSGLFMFVDDIHKADCYCNGRTERY